MGVIVTVGNEKGGTGKTTTAVCLASIAANQGVDVLLVDADLQGSAQTWCAARDENEITPRVPVVSKNARSVKAGGGGSIAKELIDLRGRYDLVIVDVGGRDSLELRGAMAVSELLISPTQASQFDLWAFERLSQIISECLAVNPDLQTRVVVSRASTNLSVSEADQAKEFLSEFENMTVSPVVIRDRIAYRRAVIEGKGVVEYGQDDKAAKEMQALYDDCIAPLL